jgi:hypothetical protein
MLPKPVLFRLRHKEVAKRLIEVDSKLLDSSQDLLMSFIPPSPFYKAD